MIEFLLFKILIHFFCQAPWVSPFPPFCAYCLLLLLTLLSLTHTAYVKPFSIFLCKPWNSAGARPSYTSWRFCSNGPFRTLLTLTIRVHAQSYDWLPGCSELSCVCCTTLTIWPIWLGYNCLTPWALDIFFPSNAQILLP